MVDSVGTILGNHLDLVISLTPTQEGDLTIIHPSLESNVFKNYCVEINIIPESEHFVYRTDDKRVLPEEIDEYSDSIRVKLHYEHDTEYFQISFWCFV